MCRQSCLQVIIYRSRLCLSHNRKVTLLARSNKKIKMSSKFELLPEKVIKQIASYLLPRDVMNLRLSSQALYNVRSVIGTMRFTFLHYQFCFSPKDLQFKRRMENYLRPTL